MSPLSLNLKSQATSMLIRLEEHTALDASMNARDTILAEVPVGATVAPVGPVGEGVGVQVVARGPGGAAALGDLRLDEAEREEGARLVVDLVVRVLDVGVAREVVDRRALAAAAAYVGLEAHLGGCA
jgi:hypothetical protein